MIVKTSRVSRRPPRQEARGNPRQLEHMSRHPVRPSSLDAPDANAATWSRLRYAAAAACGSIARRAANNWSNVTSSRTERYTVARLAATTSRCGDTIQPPGFPDGRTRTQAPLLGEALEGPVAQSAADRPLSFAVASSRSGGSRSPLCWKSPCSDQCLEVGLARRRQPRVTLVNGSLMTTPRLRWRWINQYSRITVQGTCQPSLVKPRRQGK